MESLDTTKRSVIRVSEGIIFHSACYVRNGNFLKSGVSEIHLKRIHVNQGVGVLLLGISS